MIRKMKACDQEAVLALQNTGWTKVSSPVYDRQWTLVDLEENIMRGMSFYVLEEAQQVVGVIDFGPYYSFPAGRHVATFGILIKEGYQNKGYGSLLMQAVIEEAKAQGYEKLALHVMGENHTAIHFYHKHGFKEEARLTKAFKIDNHYMDGLILAKDLEE